MLPNESENLLAFLLGLLAKPHCALPPVLRQVGVLLWSGSPFGDEH